MLKEKAVYQFILQLIPSVLEIESSNSKKSISSGYMNLNVDCLNIKPNQIIIALSNNYKQDGNIVPDPDMAIIIFLLENEVQCTSYKDIFDYQCIDETILLFKKLNYLNF